MVTAVAPPRVRHEEPLGLLLPQVITDVPGPESRAMAARLRQHESPAASTIAAGQLPVFWDRSGGANVVDVDGNRYVELTAGFCVAVVGHSNPRVAAAVAEQAARLMHSQGVLNPNPRRLELNEKLARLAPGQLDVVHLTNTGAEAIEVALKTARLHTGRHTVIAFQGGFHGKLGGALAASSQNYYREPFVSVLPGVVHLPYPNTYRNPFGSDELDAGALCAAYLKRVLTFPDSGVADVAAIIMEPIQGHAGWVVPPSEFVQTVRRLCDERGILLIADEIITGFGRTGRWFAVEQHGIVPDILVCAKGMASGFPISAVITTPEIARSWGSAQQSSTFLGHPVGCAAALASIAEIEEHDLVERSARLGATLKQRLAALQERHPLIGEVRGLGLMVALELVRDRATKEPAPAETARVVEALLRRGIMATNSGGSYHNVIKLSPPLMIGEAQLDCAVELIDESIREVAATL